MLALLHAASSQEARLLRVDNIDQARCSVRLGERPHPVPLDPATWATLLRRLDHRAAQYTANPHVILEGCGRGQEVARRVGRRATEFLRDRTLRSRGLPAYQADPDAGRCVERYDACEPGPLSQFETEFERCADWAFPPLATFRADVRLPVNRDRPAFSSVGDRPCVVSHRSSRSFTWSGARSGVASNRRVSSLNSGRDPKSALMGYWFVSISGHEPNPDGAWQDRYLPAPFVFPGRR